MSVYKPLIGSVIFSIQGNGHQKASDTFESLKNIRDENIDSEVGKKATSCVTSLYVIGYSGPNFNTSCFLE